MSDVLHLDLAGAVATVTLNRPDAMNALDTELKVALRDTLAEVAEDDAVRAVVLTGAGRAFCVGQDLAEHAHNLETDSDAVWSTVPEHYTPIASLLATMPKPVVAAINGTAAGAGAAFAFACDFRVAADTAKLTMAFSAV
ncbi:MAG TPA: enoyl-CoA hydratase-related protein, partial [Actinomycetes bacterium]|nr:enoyl-CoA hydratase-related protein [Actinomycetes bacterium]